MINSEIQYFTKVLYSKKSLMPHLEWGRQSDKSLKLTLCLIEFIGGSESSGMMNNRLNRKITSITYDKV